MTEDELLDQFCEEFPHLNDPTQTSYSEFERAYEKWLKDKRDENLD